MAKIFKFFLIFLFFFNSAIYANALSNLDKFDKNFNSASNKEKIAMHQELRTLYVKSIMENNVNLKSNSSDIYFKIRYATMLCGLGLPSVNFAPKKPLHFACCSTQTAPAFYFGL